MDLQGIPVARELFAQWKRARGDRTAPTIRPFWREWESLLETAGIHAAIEIEEARRDARVLEQGARFVFTCDESDDERPSSVPDWQPIVEAGGLAVERKEEIPRFAEQLGRMYALWLANEEALRAVLGDEELEQLLDEAKAVGPTLSSRRAFIFTARKP